MEFEHVEHKEGGGHKGIGKSLSLFKKKPFLMIGGVVVVILLVIFSKSRGTNTADATATDIAASGLDGYPTAGASGTGGATGISSDQIDEIKSSIAASLTSDFTGAINNRLTEIQNNISESVDQQFESHVGQDESKYNQFIEGFSDQYAKDLQVTNASIGKVTDAISGVTNVVDHLNTTINPPKSVDMYRVQTSSGKLVDTGDSKTLYSLISSGAKVVSTANNAPAKSANMTRYIGKDGKLMDTSDPKVAANLEKQGYKKMGV